MMACDGEVKSQACRAGVNIEGRKDVLASIADIEDIVRMGTMKSVRTTIRSHISAAIATSAAPFSMASCLCQKHLILLQVCPFYATKALAEDADIVFMPYNYVMEDAQNMAGLLANSVLILDEAHNVENACQDTASFDLTSGAAVQCFLVSR